MNDFTASNGVMVKRLSDSRLTVESARDFDHLLPENEAGLREFFQHEYDEELGRWRWPENPEYVVYPRTSDPARKARGVTVLSERIPRPYTVWEDNVDTLYGTSTDENSRKLARNAARAYFEAHPKRKPWEDAKPGEVWELQISGCHSPEIYRFAQDTTCADSRVYRPVNNPKRVFFDPESPLIISGRRIYPESD